MTLHIPASHLAARKTSLKCLLVLSHISQFTYINLTAFAKLSLILSLFPVHLLVHLSVHLIIGFFQVNTYHYHSLVLRSFCSFIIIIHYYYFKYIFFHNLVQNVYIKIILLRFNIATPADLPRACVCRATFTTEHTLTCPTGGFAIIRHNEVRDLTANQLNYRQTG